MSGHPHTLHLPGPDRIDPKRFLLTKVLGFLAIVFIFRFRSFKEVMARARAHRRGEDAVPPEPPDGGATPDGRRAARQPAL